MLNLKYNCFEHVFELTARATYLLQYLLICNPRNRPSGLTSLLRVNCILYWKVLFSFDRGSIKYQEVICKFLAVAETVQLRHSLIRKTSFSIGVHTRERKDMSIEFENSIETRNCSTYVEIKMKYFGIENKSYRFICSVDLEDLNGLQKFKTESSIAYSSPTGLETSFTTEVTHRSSPSERVAQLKVCIHLM